jgi:hypothetical protein
LRKLTIPPFSPARRAGASWAMPRSLESTQRRKGAETQQFPLVGPSTCWGMSDPRSFPRHLSVPCGFASWRLCVNKRPCISSGDSGPRAWPSRSYLR